MNAVETLHFNAYDPETNLIDITTKLNGISCIFSVIPFDFDVGKPCNCYECGERARNPMVARTFKNHTSFYVRNNFPYRHGS